MRKKMMKQIRSKLYSNFVRAGTMTGGKMEEAADKEEQLEVVKDLSKIKELTDEQLVAACNGLTAHKGGRHGLNMKAKLDRIAEAEREFMLKYGGGAGDTKSNTVVQEETVTKKSKKKRKAEAVVEEEIHSEKKSKKKKLKEEIDVAQCTEVPDI